MNLKRIIKWLVPIASFFCHGGSDYIQEHIEDGLSWHILTWGEKELSIPTLVCVYHSQRGWVVAPSSRFHNVYKGLYIEDGKIKAVDKATFYDFSITKNTLASLLALLLLILLLWGSVAVIQRRNKISYGIGKYGLVLFFIQYMRKKVAHQLFGKKRGDKYLPYLLSLFLFIAANNLLGLFPGWANVTGNISTALAMTTVTFTYALYNSTSYYWRHFFCPSGAPIWMAPVIAPIECLGFITKASSLSMRLTANMFAGHFAILSILDIIFSLKPVILAVAISIPFAIFLFCLKVLVSILQAYIFMFLSAKLIAETTSNHH